MKYPRAALPGACLLVTVFVGCSSSSAAKTTHPPATDASPGGGGVGGGSPVNPGAGGADAGPAAPADGAQTGAGGTGGSGAADGGAPPFADSGNGGSVAALETVTVPAAGTATSMGTLAMGELYLLRASGLVTSGTTKVDAEYGGFGADDTGGMDTFGGADVGLDTGMKELVLSGAGRNTDMYGPGRLKWFGGFRADHVYFQVVTGNGMPLSLRLVKPAGGGAGDSGSLTVSFYKLTPGPPALEDASDTVMVSYLKGVSETSKVTPAAGKIYLLQSLGESQVGGPGNNGDADFDDYRNGATPNEGEGGADFGICVDEGCLAKRTKKWGLFRKDHTYYMLYAGTGMPIKFTYCDTGYGDNLGAVPVKLFQVP